MFSFTSAPKEDSINQLLAQLYARLGSDSFEVVDHWDADLCAVGITKPGVPLPLVYMSTYNMAPGRYFVTLDVSPAPGTDLPYQTTLELRDVSFEELVSTAAHHLHIPLPDEPTS